MKEIAQKELSRLITGWDKLDEMIKINLVAAWVDGFYSGKMAGIEAFTQISSGKIDTETEYGFVSLNQEKGEVIL